MYDFSNSKRHFRSPSQGETVKYVTQFHEGIELYCLNG